MHSGLCWGNLSEGVYMEYLGFVCEDVMKMDLKLGLEGVVVGLA
jgi:hypothetical protein